MTYDIYIYPPRSGQESSVHYTIDTIILYIHTNNAYYYDTCDRCGQEGSVGRTGALSHQRIHPGRRYVYDIRIPYITIIDTIILNILTNDAY
jgi:hypothetical protein